MLIAINFRWLLLADISLTCKTASPILYPQSGQKQLLINQFNFTLLTQRADSVRQKAIIHGADRLVSECYHLSSIDRPVCGRYLRRSASAGVPGGEHPRHRGKTPVPGRSWHQHPLALPILQNQRLPRVSRDRLPEHRAPLRYSRRPEKPHIKRAQIRHADHRGLRPESLLP